MSVTYVIPGMLDTYNDYQDAARRNRYIAAKRKKRCEDHIMLFLKPVVSFDCPVVVTFRWYWQDKRRDKDNVAFAKKFVLDAMQSAGIIERDSWKLCTPYDVGFGVDKGNERVEVTVWREDEFAERQAWLDAI